MKNKKTRTTNAHASQKPTLVVNTDRLAINVYGEMSPRDRNALIFRLAAHVEEESPTTAKWIVHANSERGAVALGFVGIEVLSAREHNTAVDTLRAACAAWERS